MKDYCCKALRSVMKIALKMNTFFVDLLVIFL